MAYSCMHGHDCRHVQCTILMCTYCRDVVHTHAHLYNHGEFAMQYAMWLVTAVVNICWTKLNIECVVWGPERSTHTYRPIFKRRSKHESIEVVTDFSIILKEHWTIFDHMFHGMKVKNVGKGIFWIDYILKRQKKMWIIQ